MSWCLDATDGWLIDLNLTLATLDPSGLRFTKITDTFLSFVGVINWKNADRKVIVQFKT